ncbi:hypothetical protein RHSIM_Rhsim05G0028100 [Rhododendron simsii]|uniref:Uncharacterized protein n=1 Tax=Rhododendron simsii TaxID=118357 RepID=A0A834GXB0_RHOSS|nr:hypothetical protein RHSIM_Rhsim05G0028100 [Rhododendron simsii]
MVASCSYHSREDNRTPEEEGIMHDGIFVMVQINSYLSPGHFYGTLKNGVIFPFVTPIAGIDWQNPLEDMGIPLIVYVTTCKLAVCVVVLPSLLFRPPKP